MNYKSLVTKLLNEKLGQIIPYLLMLTLFSLPLSSTAKSIFFGISILCILLHPASRRDLPLVLSTTWCRVGIFLFIIALISSLWSPADLHDKKFVIEKYSKLLYLPLLAIGFQSKSTRKLGIYAFLAAVFITSMLSILKYKGYLQSFNFNADHVFRNHIMTGFMVAFAAYLSLLFALRQKSVGRIAYLFLGLVFTYHVLFVNAGRIGYILYFLLMCILLLQLSNWKQALGGGILIVLVFILAYFISPVMKQRVDAISQQIVSYQLNQKNTDIGMRLQFHDFAYKLFKRSPLFGNGLASFTYYFEKEKPTPVWSWRLWEPHSQYWLVTSELGLLGIVTLFTFFISLIQASLKLKWMKAIALALIPTFMVGNLSDSLLFYSGSGYFFILFMALCLGEQVELRKSKELVMS